MAGILLRQALVHPVADVTPPRDSSRDDDEPSDLSALRGHLRRPVRAVRGDRAAALAGRIGLAPTELVEDVVRLRAAEERLADRDTLVLIVSVPHGGGHDVDGVEAQVARRQAGVDANLLTDGCVYDAIAGNAALNGVPVTLSPC